MKYKRISADCHLDLCWMPPGLFVENAPRAMRERMPHVVDGKEGAYWTSSKGAMLGFVGGANPQGKKPVKGDHHRIDAMAETGLYSDMEQGINHIADPHRRIKVMERDGVDAEVIYGILATTTMMGDDEAAALALQIYNDWIKDFCSHYPERQIGLACIPLNDMTQAAAEIRRVAKLGLRGVEIPTQYDSKPLWHKDWDPIWEAVNEVGLPVHFHAFPPLPLSLIAEAGERRPAAIFTALSIFQTAQFNQLAALIGGGVLERYPNIRVAFGEIGLGWLPYALDRMDFEWEEQKRFRTFMKLKPSEYWARQCRASFQFERVGTRFVDLVGVDTLMWGSDFPHGDGTWPDSSSILKEHLGHLSPEDFRKITCDNARKFYNLAA